MKAIIFYKKCENVKNLINNAYQDSFIFGKADIFCNIMNKILHYSYFYKFMTKVGQIQINSSSPVVVNCGNELFNGISKLIGSSRVANCLSCLSNANAFFQLSPFAWITMIALLTFSVLSFIFKKELNIFVAYFFGLILILDISVILSNLSLKELKGCSVTVKCFQKIMTNL